jgi:ring-1,2-phenylacetyl-CoA epoxidase subunit PaaD
MVDVESIARNEVEQLVWERLGLIPDPEVPVISILELGIVRDVRWDGKQLTITITPTYTGCPAMTLFAAEIRAAMHDQGIDNVQLETVYAPAWTTDWLSAEAKEKLKKYGIAPPVKNAVSADDLFAEPPAVPCPRCGSEHTTLKSQFGSTACKSLYLCGDCKEPFEYFKHF